MKESKVTFGGGAHGKIKGKGELTKLGLPKLMNVFYVQGITANLISVSQLFDKGLTVTFNKVQRWAVDEKNHVALSGIRPGNNCYMREQPDVYFRAKRTIQRCGIRSLDT